MCKGTHAGVGPKHINKVLATPNIPALTNNTFKHREREVGHTVEVVAKNSCREVLNDEKNIALKNRIKPNEDNVLPVACSFNLIWAGKRERKGTIPTLAMLQ